MEFVHKNLNWIICSGSIISFITLAFYVLQRGILQFDITVYDFVSKYLIKDNVTPLVKCITQFGSAWIFIPITLYLYYVTKNKEVCAMVGSNLLVATLLNNILKLTFQRVRPTDSRLVSAIGYSFPSGHSMVSMAFYGLFIYLICKGLVNGPVKYLLIFLISLLIISIGFSRIYLGVHYTSDVLAGFIVGIAYLIIFIDLFNKYTLRVIL